MNELTDPNSFFKVDGVTYARSRVTATLKLATSLPEDVLAANKTVASSIVNQDKGNPDLVWVSFLLDTEGPNLNWDYMPRASLIRRYGSAAYKPFDVDHVIEEMHSMVGSNKMHPPVRNTIFGVMTGARLADAQGNLLTQGQINDLDPTDDYNRPEDQHVTVVAWAALWAFLFPKTVGMLMDSIKNGNMHVSMERWISDWDYLTKASGSIKSCTKAEAENNGVATRWAMRQHDSGGPIYRRSLDFIYGGVASTAFPANKKATFMVPGDVVSAAAHTNGNKLLDILLKKHGELHQRFAVSTSDQESAAIIVEHTEVTKAIAAIVGKE